VWGWSSRRQFLRATVNGRRYLVKLFGGNLIWMVRLMVSAKQSALFRAAIQSFVGTPVAAALVSAMALSACAHGSKASSSGADQPPAFADALKPLAPTGPIDLKLKADAKRVEKVAYFHRSRSTSYEEVEKRAEKEETLEFTSQAETLKTDPSGDRFTQVITVPKKQGTINLHDFAMPEVGEKLEITADSRGRIIRAGDYPQNSIFYVPPISLPDGPVSVGDTWPLQSTWMSLEEMVPYQLDMVSIFKHLWSCGSHRCAELEISGEVSLQGPLVQMMAFKSLWKGFLIFDIDAGTVAWSKVESEEQFMSGNVRRSVTSCLEATLLEPSDIKLQGKGQPACATLPAPGDIAPVPGSLK
jgi:hypothetical protein